MTFRLIAYLKRNFLEESNWWIAITCRSQIKLQNISQKMLIHLAMFFISVVYQYRKYAEKSKEIAKMAWIWNEKNKSIAI